MVLTFFSNCLTKPLGNETDELNWYKPIAVILKPATNEDLQKRLQLDVPLPHPVWPKVEDDLAFNPWTPYESRNAEIYEDKLREFYETFDLPRQIERNLLSIARMGLVAIPRTEIGQGNLLYLNIKRFHRMLSEG